jgi:hypothetical protein
MHPGARFAIFKTQNFEETGQSLVVLEASAETRLVRSVVDPGSVEIVPIINALCTMLRCQPGDLERRLSGYTFAVRMSGELFVRSVAAVDVAGDRSAFIATSIRATNCIWCAPPIFPTRHGAIWANSCAGGPSRWGRSSMIASCDEWAIRRIWRGSTGCGAIFRRRGSPPLASFWASMSTRR